MAWRCTLTRNPSTWNRNGAELAALPERLALGTCRRGELAALPERQRKMPTGSRTGGTLGQKLWVVGKRPKIVQGHAGLGRSCPSALMGGTGVGGGRGREIVRCRYSRSLVATRGPHSCWRRGNEATSCQSERIHILMCQNPKKKKKLVSAGRSLPLQHLQPPCELAMDRRPHRHASNCHIGRTIAPR